MTVGQVIKYFGTGAEAARKLGMTRAIVTIWRTRGIPYSRQLHIEKITGGKLKAMNDK